MDYCTLILGSRESRIAPRIIYPAGTPAYPAFVIGEYVLPAPRVVLTTVQCFSLTGSEGFSLLAQFSCHSVSTDIVLACLISMHH